MTETRSKDKIHRQRKGKEKIDFFGEVKINSKFLLIQGDQNVLVHLMIKIKKSGAERLFDGPV
jgi:hypothetical protein